MRYVCHIMICNEIIGRKTDIVELFTIPFNKDRLAPELKNVGQPYPYNLSAHITKTVLMPDDAFI